MIMPGSCSKGLRSRPSPGIGTRRSNGLEVRMRKARKPTLTVPSTPSTRARKAAVSEREKPATAACQRESDSAHRSIEPSWLPHTPVRR